MKSTTRTYGDDIEVALWCYVAFAACLLGGAVALGRTVAEWIYEGWSGR